MAKKPRKNKAKVKQKNSAELQLRDIPGKVASLTKAILTGTRISEERVRKRMEICLACPHVQVAQISGKPNDDEHKRINCGICGCRLSAGERELINLAAYEETKDYGCKAKGGSKWKKAGV